MTVGWNGPGNSDLNFKNIMLLVRENGLKMTIDGKNIMHHDSCNCFRTAKPIGTA